MCNTKIETAKNNIASATEATLKTNIAMTCFESIILHKFSPNLQRAGNRIASIYSLSKKN